MRLPLRVLVYLVATVATGVLLWYVLVFVSWAFGARTRECKFSDNCDTFGNVVYEFGDGWPVIVGCILLGAMFMWRFLPIRR